MSELATSRAALLPTYARTDLTIVRGEGTWRHIANFRGGGATLIIQCLAAGLLFMVFDGAFTALVTPFTRSGDLDEAKQLAPLLGALGVGRIA